MDGRRNQAARAAAPLADASDSAQRWDWNGVIGTGQSLSVGAEARETTLTTQPFSNLKLALGAATVASPPYEPNDPMLRVVPLVEPIRPEATAFPGAYPLNIYGETPHTAMADQISALYKRDYGGDYVTVHTVVGESGQGMDVIDKTAAVTPDRGHAYAASLFEVSALKRLAALAGKTYGVAGIILTHGETDSGNADYESKVVELYTDYNRDIETITGQSGKIPLLLSQQQTCPRENSTTASLFAQWKAGVDHPDDIICIGPEYPYPHALDGLHLVASGYDRLGEKYAEVYYERVVRGRGWRPLEPVAIGRKHNAITVTFHVPVPPLAWDDALPAPHQTQHTAWSRGRGFEVENDQGAQTILSVVLDGNTVIITLAVDPAGPGLTVRYAVTQDGIGTLGGLATGRIGQLRDSDPLVGYSTGAKHYNYALSFALPVE